MFAKYWVQVVVKIIEHGRTDAQRDACVREATAMQNLHHPCIVGGRVGPYEYLARSL
jgi:hypothetical protein